MAGELKVKNKHPILVILDADILDDFKKAISPLGVSDYFRRHQQEIVSEHREKNAEGSGLAICPSLPKQTTLISYIINNINSLVETPDDVLNEIVLKVPKKRANQIFDKFGSVRRTIMKAHPR